MSKTSAQEWYEQNQFDAQTNKEVISKRVERLKRYKSNDFAHIARGARSRFKILSDSTRFTDCRSITKSVIGYLYFKFSKTALRRGYGYLDLLDEIATSAGLPNLVGTSVHDLLCMTAGLRDMSFESAERINNGEALAHDPDNADYDVDFAKRYNPPDTCTLADWCRAHKPIERLVDVFHYDNVNYDILAHLAPFIFGMSITDMLKTLGVSDMMFSYTRHGHPIGSTGLLARAQTLAEFAERVRTDVPFVAWMEVEKGDYEFIDHGFSGYKYGWWFQETEDNIFLCGIGSQGQRLVSDKHGTICMLVATGLQLGEYAWLYEPECPTSWTDAWDVQTAPMYLFMMD